eukprot:6758394-Pyramimonas_sp.AAC.1
MLRGAVLDMLRGAVSGVDAPCARCAPGVRLRSIEGVLLPLPGTSAGTSWRDELRGAGASAAPGWRSTVYDGVPQPAGGGRLRQDEREATKAQRAKNSESDEAAAVMWRGVEDLKEQGNNVRETPSCYSLSMLQRCCVSCSP